MKDVKMKTLKLVNTEQVIGLTHSPIYDRSAKHVGLQMLSERRRGESCSFQSGW